MKSRCISVVAVLAGMLLFSMLGFAQEETTKILTAPSLDGTTGLFKTWDAENLRRGETNWTFGYDLFHRDPGKLTIGQMPVGVAVGIFDRFELFATMDVQKHVRARAIRSYRRPGLKRPRAPKLVRMSFGIMATSGGRGHWGSIKITRRMQRSALRGRKSGLSRTPIWW